MHFIYKRLQNYLYNILQNVLDVSSTCNVWYIYCVVYTRELQMFLVRLLMKCSKNWNIWRTKKSYLYMKWFCVYIQSDQNEFSRISSLVIKCMYIVTIVIAVVACTRRILFMIILCVYLFLQMQAYYLLTYCRIDCRIETSWCVWWLLKYVESVSAYYLLFGNKPQNNLRNKK